MQKQPWQAERRQAPEPVDTLRPIAAFHQSYGVDLNATAASIVGIITGGLGAAGAFGPYPANEAARSTDVILALGCRFSDLHTSSWVPGYTYSIPPTRLIHVDIDPSEINKNKEAHIPVVSDVKAQAKPTS